MKTQLRLFYLLLFCGLSLTGYSQIDYSEDFEGTIGWDGDFYEEFFYACDGEYSWTGNFYFYDGDLEPTTAETISPSIGNSNGSEITLSYSYSLLDWDTEEAMPNSPSWGNYTLEYGASVSGPWTVIETVSPSNHVESDDCAVRTVTFTPPAGPVYLRFFATPGAVPGPDEYIDVLLNIDDISAVQDVPDCIGTPAESATVASSVFACNTADIALSLSPSYGTAGLSFQWQSSTDGESFTDVAEDGDEATFTTTQTETTWYQAVITCDASTESVTSTPVQVVSSGLDCLCDIDFYEEVEPITLVNFAGINNITDAEVDGSPGVEDFTSLTPGEVTAGQSYNITLEGNTNGLFFDTYFTVFIDFNQNGDLTDPGESFEAGFVSASTGEDGQQAITSITIPEDALEGITYMRVVKLYNSYSEDPCSSTDGIGYGQAEDYLLNITEACTTMAPIANDEQIFCGSATVADLEAEVTATGTLIWYADETGGEPLSEDTELMDGETYYAAQLDECESEERAVVTVLIPMVPVDTLEDASACNEYELPPHDFGGYYTESGGMGEMLETGDIITESMTVYIYSESATTPNCTAETSFEVTITTVEELTGETTQTFEEGETVADLEVTGEDGAVIAWYASEEDALAGEDALSTDTELVDDMYYYATQTIGDCTSEPFEVLADMALSVNSFDASSLTYYPNPVKEVLTISAGTVIDSVEVYNLLGQQVLAVKAGAEDADVNLSGLSAGTYMVKVMSADSVKTIKIVKE